MLVTHDMEEAIHLGDRIAVMDNGQLLQYAPPEEIIAPRLISSMNSSARRASFPPAFPCLDPRGRPPVAVLALTVPVLDFGTAPTLVALFLYGLLPIFENSITGLTSLPPAVTVAARGMGVTGLQRLVRVELPLALPVILSGVRLSTVISLAAATIGSTVAARTLGGVIIAGLTASNTAFVMQGGLIVAVLD